VLQSHFSPQQRLRYLCQDEMRLGLMFDQGRVITAPGVKPIASEEWIRQSFWLYGVVDPLAGWQFCQDYPHLNSTHFQCFIDAVSLQLGDDQAIIQLDQAKAHQALALQWPDNLFPILQPPYSPELNPIERFWQHIRFLLQHESFTTLAHLRKLTYQVLDSLSSAQIASLTSYDFILEALFCAAL
jgi:hypothetical protein